MAAQPLLDDYLVGRPYQAPYTPLPYCGGRTGAIDERYEYETPDGERYDLSAIGEVSLLNFQGEGMPPIDYVTQQGPFQDGSSIKDYKVGERVEQLLLRVQGSSRSDYWNKRQQLLEILNPNRMFVPTNGVRLVTGLLRFFLPNGVIRELHCTIHSGPKFEPRSGDKWDEWAFQEVLQFIAHDPFWYDPAFYEIGSGAGGQLTTPFTLPFTLSGLDVTVAVGYVGSWRGFPQVEIVGPITNPQISNLTCGTLIKLNTSIADGDTATIYLSEVEKLVYLNGDLTDSLIQYVSNDSDLSEFSLKARTNNSLRLSGTGTGANTRITVSWQNRYLGI